VEPRVKAADGYTLAVRAENRADAPEACIWLFDEFCRRSEAQQRSGASARGGGDDADHLLGPGIRFKSARDPVGPAFPCLLRMAIGRIVFNSLGTSGEP